MSYPSCFTPSCKQPPVRAEGEETNTTMSSAKVRVQYGVTHWTDSSMQLHPELLCGCAEHDCICWSVLVEANAHWDHVQSHAEIIYMAYTAVLQEQESFKINTPAVPYTRHLGWLDCELSTTLQNTFRTLKVSHYHSNMSIPCQWLVTLCYCLKNALNSYCHTFNKVVKTCLKTFWFTSVWQRQGVAADL